MHIALQWLTVFFLVAAMDIGWAVYVSRVQKADPFGAALWAAFLMVNSGLATIGYTGDPWLLVPAVAGAFVGTYAAVWLGRK